MRAKSILTTTKNNYIASHLDHRLMFSFLMHMYQKHRLVLARGLAALLFFLCSSSQPAYCFKAKNNGFHPANKQSVDLANIKKHRRQLLSELNNKIAEDPNNGDYYFQRAFICFQLKQYKTALSNCEQALGCGYDTANLHVLKSETLFAQKNNDAALSELNKALEAKNPTAKMFALAAQLHCNLKNYADALQEISKAINMDPAQAHYYVIRANIDYKVEQYLRTIKDADKAIKLDPASSEAYLIRSKADLALKDFKQSEIDSQKAKELN